MLPRFKLAIIILPKRAATLPFGSFRNCTLKDKRFCNIQWSIQLCLIDGLLRKPDLSYLFILLSRWTLKFVVWFPWIAGFQIFSLLKICLFMIGKLLYIRIYEDFVFAHFFKSSLLFGLWWDWGQKDAAMFLVDCGINMLCCACYSLTKQYYCTSHMTDITKCLLWKTCFTKHWAQHIDQFYFWTK